MHKYQIIYHTQTNSTAAPAAWLHGLQWSRLLVLALSRIRKWEQPPPWQYIVSLSTNIQSSIVNMQQHEI
jgi:hypothetical protein